MAFKRTSILLTTGSLLWFVDSMRFGDKSINIFLVETNTMFLIFVSYILPCSMFQLRTDAKRLCLRL